MNKRYSKKRRLNYWRLAGEPNAIKWEKGLPKFSEIDCPYCGYNVADMDDETIEKIGGKRIIQNKHHFFDGTYSGKEWEEDIKCPICKTKYGYSNSNV